MAGSLASFFLTITCFLYSFSHAAIGVKIRFTSRDYNCVSNKAGLDRMPRPNLYVERLGLPVQERGFFSNSQSK